MTKYLAKCTIPLPHVLLILHTKNLCRARLDLVSLIALFYPLLQLLCLLWISWSRAMSEPLISNRNSNFPLLSSDSSFLRLTHQSLAMILKKTALAVLLLSFFTENTWACSPVCILNFTFHSFSLLDSRFSLEPGFIFPVRGYDANWDISVVIDPQNVPR